jgi:hypothetical protein
MIASTIGDHPMTNRLLALAVVGAVGAGSVASVATAHNGNPRAGSARTQVATVTSLASGTLTLKTSGGVTVTGTVTARTRIVCLPTRPAATTPGTTPSTTTPTATSPTTPSTTTPMETTPSTTTPMETTPGTTPPRRGGGQPEREDHGGRGPGGRGERMHHSTDEQRGNGAACGSGSLTAGTAVLRASSELGAAGQTFTKIVLVSDAS